MGFEHSLEKLALATARAAELYSTGQNVNDFKEQRLPSISVGIVSP